MLRGSRGVAITALLLVSALGLVLPGVAVAGDNDESSSNHAMPFLRMGAGTRALGMGGAYVATANDATAGYWNPAALAWSCGTQLSGMYALGLTEDRTMSFVAGSHRFDWGALGLSLLTAGMGDIPFYSPGSSVSSETFSYGDLAVMGHAAYATDMFAMGATVKYLHQGLDADVEGDAGVNGFGVDLGAGVQPAEWLRLGIVMKDLASEVGSYEDANNLPMNLRVGCGLMPLEGFTFGFDLDKVIDEDDLKYHAGSEFAFPVSEDFGGAVRLGINDGSLAAGVGLRVKFIQFDYAFVEEPNNFEESHRIGVTLNFGQTECGGPQFAPRDGDADLDGIPDKIDKCPNAAEDFDGYQDQDGCPDVDNDGDGIPDVDDDCPSRAEDFDGFNDQDGCPDVDNDGDGILDADDKCPGAPETFNSYQDADGCPDETGMSDCDFPPVYINFKYDSADFSHADPIPTLDAIAETLKKNPGVKVTIVGHTDSNGSDDYNMKLSLRRAEAVRDYLVGKGVAAGQFMVEGKGESQPIAGNDTDEGRARNRRIEFKVVK
jgi:outer membrane protein OmpA-like peptidoglycan-associated protein